MPHYSKHIRGFILLNNNVTIGGTNYYYIEAVFGHPSSPDDPAQFIRNAELYTKAARDAIQNYITPTVPSTPPIEIPILYLNHPNNTKLNHDGEDMLVIESVSLPKK